MKKIIILRGNSGSGKTTVARALQKKFGYNTMMISQDEIRRNILWVKDGVDTKALPLMIELMKYGYEYCDVVILEGIMYDEWYSPLFKTANELYGMDIYAYYFDIPFEETVRRHNTRDGTWNRYLHEVDEECRREVEQTVRRIMEKEGVDERLKAEKPLEWVKRVNGIKMCVEAEVERELCV